MSQNISTICIITLIDSDTIRVTWVILSLKHNIKEKYQNIVEVHAYQI